MLQFLCELSLVELYQFNHTLYMVKKFVASLCICSLLLVGFFALGF